MSISSTTNRNSYVGNGATATYNYGFRIFSASDLYVVKRNTATPPVETVLALTTDYTVSGAGDLAGGSITLVAGNLTSGHTLSIRRKRTLTQATDIRNQGDFFPETHEDAFDHGVMIAQQQQDEIDRSVKLPETITAAAFSPTLPTGITAADAAGRALIINTARTAMELGPTSDQISGAQAQATAAAASATAAATSATSSATSATASATSATAAATSATASAASATAAANTLASALWRDVVFKTFADSPYTVLQADNGKLLVFDTSGGAITVNLPSIAGLTLPYTIGMKLEAGSNAITVNRNGTDTIGGATSKVISTVGAGAQFLPDLDPAPDKWTAVDFGIPFNPYTAPTVQSFTANGTFTKPANLLYVKVRLVGGGGGGAGSGTATASSHAGAGGTTSFGALLSAAGGTGGAANTAQNGGVGGAPTVTAPAVEVLALTGSQGEGGAYTNSNVAIVGGSGGNSPFGGAGTSTYSGAGTAAIANSGSGGGGGAGNGTTALYAGNAGGSGAYIEAIIYAANLGATETVTIGAAGAAGDAGTSGYAGGAGGSGRVVAECFFQ